MLKAAKNSWFENIFAVYNRNLFRRRFNSFQARGLPNLSVGSAPLLLYANHTSWWDGLVAFELSRRAGLDAYWMMEERQLSRLRLFRRLGAFSVVREDAREAYRSIEYAAGLLNKGSAVWIFPQGEIVPSGKRPLAFYPGAAAILEKAERSASVPLAIRYEFRGGFKPDIFVSIGSVQRFEKDENAERKETTSRLEAALENELNKLAADLSAEQFESFIELL